MNFYKIYLFLFLFFISLRITSPIGIYVFSLMIPIVLFTILLINNPHKIKLSKLSFFISLSVLLSWFFISLLPDNEIIINDKQYLLAVVICFISGCFLKTIKNYVSEYDIKQIINTIILFHIIAFFTQYFAWYIFNIDFDYGILTNGNPHRALYYGGLYRATGVFEEPSIYCGYMFSFVTIKYFYDRKLTLLSYIALMSMSLTFSTIGIILSVLFFLIVNLRFRLTYIIILLISLIVIYIIAGDYIIERTMVILNGDDGSTNTKFFVLREYLNNIYIFFHGVGFIYKEKMPTNDYNGSGDLTLFLNAPIIFGVFGFPILLGLFYFVFTSNLNLKLKLIVMLSFFKMATFHHPFFWAYYYFVIYFVLYKSVKGLNDE